MTDNTIGDGPIEQRYRERMNAVASGLDTFFNGEARGADRKTGFVLLVFPFGDDSGRCNYISNADKIDIAKMMEEQIKRIRERAAAAGRDPGGQEEGN
jgi:hypothetical protein